MTESRGARHAIGECHFRCSVDATAIDLPSCANDVDSRMGNGIATHGDFW